MPVEDKEKIGKIAGTLGYKKPIAPRERHFAKLMAVEGMGGVEAARIAFGWRCEPGSKENDKARNLARAPRIAEEIKKIKEQMLAEQKAKESIRLDFGEMHKGDLREFTFKILEHLRDNPNTKAANRFNAIKMLKKLHDPGKDINLIYKWINLAWGYQTAHCPCCHKSFALAEIKNDKLNKWREQTGVKDPPKKLESRFDRQMEIISRCDPQRTPHPGQIRVYSALERHVVSEGAARSGKVLAPDTPILTQKSGWKKYCDLELGEEIFDETGSSCKIIGFSPLCTTGDWYELEFDSGEKIISHANHEWITHNYKYRAALSRRRGTRTAHTRVLTPSLIETQEIVKTLKVRKDSHVNHAIPITKPLQFPKRKLLIPPYVLGLWLGDGCATAGMISNIESEIRNEVSKYYKLTPRPNGFYPLGIWSQLKKLNLRKNKHIPITYLTASTNQRLALLQGLMDSDGYISKLGACEFTNTNLRLAKEFQYLCSTLGIKTFFTEGRATLYGKNCGPKYRIHFTTVMPIFRLTRKKKLLPQKIKKTQNYHYIINAKKVNPENGKCIEVNSPSHLYLAGKSLIPTHNSYTLAMIATMAICLPGVEIWLLAETFNRANKEIQYLENFLNALFFPHYKQMISTIHDKKTGETIISTKWGSEVRVKSSKSKGSITASALEFALCAEPGWLPADIYEELRARMSERLGRIIAIGTPKGLGGFIGRLTNMYGRDPRTGNMIRWKREERLMENGCPWGSSMLITRFDPLDNPEFVKSELEAARMELTDEEYASEFEGIGVSAEGAKFGLVREDHLKMVEESFWKRAVFLLGIDQGPKNFGACLIGYDGTDIVATWEYFDSDERTTMKRNLIRLRSRVPRWIEALGGNPEHWMMTITDQDPMLDPIFAEMEEEGQPWPTDISKRHKNFVKIGENWRRENQEFVNNMARHNHLWFNLVDLPFVEENESPGAYLLHDQVRQCIDIQEDREKESKVSSLKGWSINDPIRGDHVVDAFYMAIWLICSQQVRMPKFENAEIANDPWAREKQRFEEQLAAAEKKELGITTKEPQSAQEAWQKLVHGKNRQLFGGYIGHYGNDA